MRAGFTSYVAGRLSAGLFKIRNAQDHHIIFTEEPAKPRAKRISYEEVLKRFALYAKIQP